MLIALAVAALFYTASNGYFGSSSEKTDYVNETVYDAPVFDHFSFDIIEKPQVSGVPFTVTIRALDQYGRQFTGYMGVNILECTNGEITPFSTGVFLFGIWTGEVTVTGSVTDTTITTRAQSNPAKTGTSNTFNVA